MRFGSLDNKIRRMLENMDTTELFTPQKFHKRMLEFEIVDGVLGDYLMQSWFSEDYKLDAEVFEECKKRGLHLEPDPEWDD